jgi:hypothetical protein
MTTSSQHTPAPWKAEHTKDHGVQVFGKPLGVNWYTVAKVYALRDQQQANARLIAAAPDMFRLLTAWAAECRQYIDPPTGDPEGDDILAPVLLETDELIAKVEEGREA